MDLDALVALQHEFDRTHGWTANEADISALLRVVSEDIVGLVGEVGEFANLVKKINLDIDRDNFAAKRRLEKNRANLAEELTDSLIYIMRLAAHLRIDLESEYLAKLEINRKKYESYER